MLSLQIISKVLATKDYSIIEDNALTEEYFVGYEEEYNYIKDHVEKYNNVPDKATFLSKFDIELVDVSESDSYLVDNIREEYMYYKAVPVIQKSAELLKADANEAVRYMFQALQELQPQYNVRGTDIISEANSRYDQFVERKQHQQDWFFTTGFPELDDIIHGIQRGEELILIYARINQGKSWILEKICVHIWQLGFDIGYISPEMGANSIGYRFDTLHKNYSNKGLMWGKDDVDDEEYKAYIEELQTKKNKFLVATPKEFGNEITVTKLKNWVKQFNLHVLAIDGATYLRDERYKKGDTKTISLTNVSEDLMSLSVELGIPVLLVIQANRGGVGTDEDDSAPGLDKVKDSDGPGANSTKALSVRQLKDGVVRLEITKNRFGAVGGKLNYVWDINTGNFTFVPSDDDAEPRQRTERKTKEVKKQYKDKSDVF